MKTKSVKEPRSLQDCSKRTHLVWGRGVIEDSICVMNITDKVLLALKFDLTQKYSASKSRLCYNLGQIK